MTLVKNSEVVWTKTQLINPHARFSPYNVQIHGITADSVADAPSFSSFMADHSYLFNHYPLVIHNASFDCSVLNKCIRRDHLDLPAFDVYDTMSLARVNLPDLPSHALSDLCDYFGIALTHHDSGSDSHAAAQIMLNLLADEDSVIRTVSTLGYVAAAEKPHQSSEPRRSIGTRISIDMSSFDPLSSEPPKVTLSRSHPDFSGTVHDNLIDPQCDYSQCPSLPDVAGKRFCITCCITDQKRLTEERISAIGGKVTKNLSLKTDYLIVGTQNKAIVTEPETGKTGKIIEAESMIADGHPIKLIRMCDFLTLTDHSQVLPISTGNLLSMPSSADELSTFIQHHIVESFDDPDVFSLNKIENGFSVFLYGIKSAEMIESKSGYRFRLPGDILSALVPSKVDLVDENWYIAPDLNADQLAHLVQLLKDRKKKNFRSIITCTFACCNSYVACSDAKHCIHEHDREYNGCYYRTNLENGRIFYGKNKTI